MEAHDFQTRVTRRKFPSITKGLMSMGERKIPAVANFHLNFNRTSCHQPTLERY